MNGILIIVISAVFLLAGYLFSGRHLVKKWGMKDE